MNKKEMLDKYQFIEAILVATFVITCVMLTFITFYNAGTHNMETLVRINAHGEGMIEMVYISLMCILTVNWSRKNITRFFQPKVYDLMEKQND